MTTTDGPLDPDEMDIEFDLEDGALGGGVSAVGALTIATLIDGPVTRTTPDATLYEVAALLAADDIGALVVDDGGDGEEEATAVVTERDVIRALANLADPAEVRVHSIASTNLVWCDVTATVAEVAELMSERYLRHILVEDDGDLVGIVSSRDLLGVYAAAEDLDD
ncbi:MAG: CBS domain-containing protein [Acidimicrobiales bacterium]|nr:CBS domain-containing protein [Acidimicrobiales bacterium]